MSIRIFAALIAAISCGVAQRAWAQVTSSGGSGASDSLTVEMNGSNGWTLGAAGPIGVTLDPTKGPWQKTLVSANGDGVPANDLGVGAPNSYQLVENLVITGNIPWTDWHESIVTPGWDFGPVLLTVNGQPPPPGSSVQYIQAQWPNVGGQAEWTFPALQPGTTLTFTKTLDWIGDPTIPGEGFAGTILIKQYPTPEPTALAIFGMAAIALLRRRST